MSKMTKILLIIMAVSLVPLGMLGAMLYFGGTADSPAGGTIDLGKAADTADGGKYTGASGGTINGNVSYGTGDSTTDGSISYGTVNSTTDGNISDAADADSTGMDVTQTTDDNDYSSFYVSELPDSVWKNMQGKSYKDGCPVERKDLRYVHVMYVDFAGRSSEGELVVNKLIADDILDIFKQLYKAQYPIEKIALIDEYDGDDEQSMSDNNTSAFNFRTIAGTDIVSEHGMGLAVDVNPFYNPQVKETENGVEVSPEDAISYADRSGDFLYKIDHEDLCYKLFTEHGFEWGGDWETGKDYQHFEYVTQ